MVNVSTYYGTRDDIAPNDKTSNNIITNCRISNAKKLTTNECDIISNDHNPECDATCSNSKKGIFCSVVVAESDPPDSTSLCGAQADIIQQLINFNCSVSDPYSQNPDPAKNLNPNPEDP